MLGIHSCEIDTVVMQSTGVYWVALYQILEEHGFQVNVGAACRRDTGRKPATGL